MALSFVYDIRGWGRILKKSFKLLVYISPLFKQGPPLFAQCLSERTTYVHAYEFLQNFVYEMHIYRYASSFFYFCPHSF